MNEVNHLRKVVKELRFENKQLKAMVISYILTCFELNSSHPRVHAMSTNSRVKLPADENMPALMNIFVDENGHILDLESAALNLVDADSPYPPCTAPSRSLKNEKKLHRLFDETLIFHEQVNPAKPTDCAFASDSSISPQYEQFTSSTSVSSPDTDMTSSSVGTDNMAVLPNNLPATEIDQTLQLIETPGFPPPFISTKENTPLPGVQRFCQSYQVPNGHAENFVMLESNRQMVQDLWKSVAGPEQDSFIDGPAHQWPTNDVSFGDLDSQGYSYPPMHPIQAVQLLRLQMKVGSIIGADKDILNPSKRLLFYEIFCPFPLC
jgi:hypothetical protein